VASVDAGSETAREIEPDIDNKAAMVMYSSDFTVHLFPLIATDSCLRSHNESELAGIYNELLSSKKLYT
jgi:hypothetical protein